MTPAPTRVSISVRAKPEQPVTGVAFVPAAEDSTVTTPEAERTRIAEATADSLLDEDPFPDTKAEAWKKAVQLLQSGVIASYEVLRCNKGGVVVKAGALEGFVPYNMVDPSRLPADRSEIEGCLSDIVGTSIGLKVVRVDVPSRDLVLSERAALLQETISGLKVGEVREAKVTSVRDFGAFCSLRMADGEHHGVEGLIHISELSWQRISAPDAVVKNGQSLQVKIIGVDKKKMQISLSLKQLQDDPIKQTLEDLLPADQANADADGTAAFTGDTLSGVQLICDGLLAQPGVDSVSLGRRGHNDRVVAQDLEIWLTTQEVEGGFNVVARAGTDVQEVRVVTKMTRTEMKEAVRRVLDQLP